MAKNEKPKEQPKAVEPVEQPKPKIDNTGLEGLVGKTIDERMADLLADHKRMGAR